VAIQSNIFGRVTLSGDDAKQFVAHMEKDQPNPKAKASLKRGRHVLARLKAAEARA